MMMMMILVLNQGAAILSVLFSGGLEYYKLCGEVLYQKLNLLRLSCAK